MLKKLCRIPSVTSSSSRYLHTNQSAFSQFFVESLHNKNLLKISGDESLSFLQGLVTVDTKQLENEGNIHLNKSLYSMMLNVQGRILFDMFIHKVENIFKEKSSIILEAEESQINDLVKHLKRYKIRKKLDFTIDNDLSVWVLMKKTADKNDFKFKDNSHSFYSQPDPRLAWLAHRVLLPKDLKGSDIIDQSEEITGMYKKLRYEHGVAEGPLELPPTSSLPLEANLQFLNGVSFKKGCYIGQELTARSHHTGVIRKRIMPISSTEEYDINPHEEDFRIINSTTNKEVGKVRGWQGSKGIGVLRLQESLLGTGSLLLAKKLNNTGTFTEDYKLVGQVTTRIPEWWPTNDDVIIKGVLQKLNS